MMEVAVIILGYLIGSIPMAYIVGRATKKIDIRRYGSGNVGASNIWFHVGKSAAIPLGSFDLFAKGAFPVYFVQQLGADEWVAMATGLSSVIGHNWSIYLKFTGGRGVTVAAGVLLILAWKELLALVLVGLAGWLIFRSSALWVGISIALIPAWSLGFGDPLHITVLCVLLVAIAATKRCLSNKGTTKSEIPWRSLLVHRLLYDRDIGSRDEWVYKTPPETQEDG